MTVLKANNIHKSFGNIQVLKGVNLILESGESMAILGRSGEGKTTLPVSYTHLTLPTILLV